MFTLPARAVDWHSESLPAYDQLFQHTNGWIGADGNFAVTLTNGLTLWLFSDTFIGEVRDGHREHTTMIHNSAAWQHGIDPASAHVEFFHGKSDDGKPLSLISPADGRGYFWLFDGVMARGKLFLFLAQIEPAGDGGAFGFRQIGTWLGEVSNPLAPPTEWHIVQQKIPFDLHGTNENYSFGSAVLATNGFIYIFGTREFKSAGKQMILARAPETDLGNFATWQFRAKAGWTTNTADMADLCGSMASEYSVSWLPALKRYVLICTEDGLSEKIMARTAPKPWGPWSAAAAVYRCPESAQDKRTFCYSAKAHPMLATTADELIVTYAANSFEFLQLMNNAQLYWPRFVLVKLKPKD
ncbi:MAG: DUF4185 domain-containing protein [Limisphaerales bacterium]